MSKEIKLTQGKVAIIDDEDLPKTNHLKWCATKNKHNFYAINSSTVISGKRKKIWMHRLVVNAPDGFEVDHLDGNGLNNQKTNLRICTRAENGRNRKKNTSSTSIYKGVYWRKNRNRWQAQIKLNGKDIYIGRFVNEIDAAKAYDHKAKELFGNFAQLNFQQEGNYA